MAYNTASQNYMLLDIAIAVVDKILPEVVKRFVPLVEIQPKKLKFTKSEWTSNFSFYLYNRSDQALFDVYLLIEIGDAKTEDIDISKNTYNSGLQIHIGAISMNYELVRLNCVYNGGRDFIILKATQIDPKSFMLFKIAANTDSEVKFKIIKYSKEQSVILHKSQAGSVQFEMPLKTKNNMKVMLKGLGTVMKKDD